MPSPVIYVAAVMGAVAAGVAFKEFVYDPHIAPVIEAAWERRRQQRYGRLEDPVGFFSPFAGSGSGVEMRERRGSGLRRRGIVPHSPKDEIIFDTDIDRSATSFGRISHELPSSPTLNERPSVATVRSPAQKSRSSSYIPSPSLPSEISAGLSSSFLLDTSSALQQVPSVKVEQATPIGERFPPQPQPATPEVPSLSISHPVSLHDSDGEVLSAPGSVVSDSTSSLSASRRFASGSPTPGQSVYHSFVEQAAPVSPPHNEADWSFPGANPENDLVGLITPLSPTTSSSSLSDLDMRSSSSHGVDLLSDMDIRSVRSDREEDFDDLESVGTVESGVNSLASWEDDHNEFGPERH